MAPFWYPNRAGCPVAFPGPARAKARPAREISPTLQVRLQRVLQEHSYEPLGATRPEKSPARILVATNRDLAAMVKNGEFRQDLYYRINVISLELPPCGAARRISLSTWNTLSGVSTSFSKKT